MLGSNTYISFSRKRKELVNCFRTEYSLVCCSDIPHLLKEMGVYIYNTSDWPLFLDNSKRSLKCVWLHNGNLIKKLNTKSTLKNIKKKGGT